jgi:two-component system, chemotaxis family, sensor kinase CheA
MSRRCHRRRLPDNLRLVENSVDPDILAAFLEDAADVFGQWEKFCLELKSNEEPIVFDVLLRCAHNLKGSAGLAGFPAMHARLHHFEDHIVKMRNLEMVGSTELISILLEMERVLRDWIESLKTNGDPEYAPNTDALDQRIERLLSGEMPLEMRETTPAPVAKKRSAAVESSKTDETLRVSASKLDRLIQLVGEISLHQSMLVRATLEKTLDTDAVRSVIDLKSKLTQDLQDAALTLRMIPVEGLFQKIERLVRDVATHENKHVEVVRIGDDVALDKLIVEGMVEPLIHIARNAVDHGIETAADRTKMGKPPFGTVRLIAENTTSGVTLTFQDDGRGIDPERVYRKAIEKGLVDPSVEITPYAKLQLIFMAGLSTAEKVTELSGRGVGMDVVAAEVQRMAGQLEVLSDVGKGTRILITLPTNLSIVDALIVRVAGCLYAIPNRDLSEVLDLRDYRVTAIDGDNERAIDLRGRIIPVALIDLFLSQNDDTAWAEYKEERSLIPKPGVVVIHGEDMMALAVDAILGQSQIFVRPLMGHLTPVSYFSGSTILSDGEPCVILNVPEMARRYFTSQ